MKPRNKAVNILTAIAAVLLSILLVPSLFATGLVSAVNQVRDADTIENTIDDVIDAIDFEKLIMDGLDKSDLSQEDLDWNHVIISILESEAAEDFFELYAEDVEAYLEGSYDRDDAAVDSRAIRGLVREHLDEMVDVMTDLNPDASKKELRQTILDITDQHAAELADTLAVENVLPRNVGRIFSDYSGLVNAAVWLGAMVCLLWGGLIYLCRKYRFGGFIWLSVNTGLASLWLLIAVLLLKLPILGDSIASTSEQASLLNIAFSAAAGLLMPAIWVMLVLTVVFAGTFLLLKYTVLRRRDAAAQEVENSPYVPMAVPTPTVVTAEPTVAFSMEMETESTTDETVSMEEETL